MDEDGEIIFEEFLQMVSGAKGGNSGGGNQIQNFFKQMMDGKYPAFTN